MNEPREIQPEFVAVAFSIWALNFAQLALEARVHHIRGFGGGEFSHIATVVIVERGKKTGKAVAVFKAEPAAMTDFKRSPDLLV